MPWVPRRESATHQLEAFISHCGRDYARLRNFDRGPGRHVHVSRLSPFLRHRLILETEVIAAAVRAHGPADAEKFVQEVFWRTYFKGWLEQHPAVWKDYRSSLTDLMNRLATEPILSARHAQAFRGETGIDCFDHWVRELKQTGYLHNHARMWFASIWVFTLDLPWQLGADFFYRYLLDGDAASNTLSWRWVCGLHTKGKAYLARGSNIEKFTGGRFDPTGQLSLHAAAVPDRSDAPLVALAAPAAVAIPTPFGLLLTSEDCHPESLPLHASPTALLGLVAGEERSTLPMSAVAGAFGLGAVRDALQRCEQHFDVAAEVVESWDEFEAILGWAERAGIRTIVTAHAAVGPIAHRLRELKSRLAHEGIELIAIMRDFDRLAWPHTTKGFFRLKKKIPALIKTLELASSRAAST